MVEVADQVEALASVQSIRQGEVVRPPSLPERAIPLPGDDTPARVRQRARRAEMVALHVCQQCSRSRRQQLPLGVVVPLRLHVGRIKAALRYGDVLKELSECLSTLSRLFEIKRYKGNTYKPSRRR